MPSPLAEEQRPRAFTFHEVQAKMTLSRGLLLDIATACVGTPGDRKNEAVTRLGFLCAELSNHPERENDEVGRSFSITGISEATVYLTINLSLLQPLSEMLVKSTNKAVAALGFECQNAYDKHADAEMDG